MTFLQKTSAFIIKYWQRKKQCSSIGLAANSSDSKQSNLIVLVKKHIDFKISIPFYCFHSTVPFMVSVD